MLSSVEIWRSTYFSSISFWYKVKWRRAHSSMLIDMLMIEFVITRGCFEGRITGTNRVPFRFLKSDDLAESIHSYP